MSSAEKGKIFARRNFIVGGFKASLFLALTSRLYYLQVVEAEKYKTYSDSNRIRTQLVPPIRGKLLDKNGEIIATNKNYYRIIFDPQIVKKNRKHLIQKLSDILKIGDVGFNKMMKKINAHRSRRPLIIYEHLSWQDLSRVEVNAPELPGISIDVGQIRDFYLGDRAANLIGYLGPVSEKEIEKNPLLNHPDFKIGRSGIEKLYENRLRGKIGLMRMEVDAFGLNVRQIDKEEGKEGETISLTIDNRLQEFAAKRMGDQTGSIVVMDTQNGNIIAMVSTPGFKPEAFTYGVDPDYWRELIENKNKPLMNKSITAMYPPGSTFKGVVALAALKAGINPNKKINCTGHVWLGRRKFHCWKENGHGPVNMQQALKYSCNSYFYTIAKEVGEDEIAKMAEKFGFGVDSGLDLYNEKTGTLPSSDWKIKKYKERWQKGDTLNYSIGQGYLLATPIQLATMMARIVSGRKITPNIDLSNSISPETIESLDLPERDLDIVKRGFVRVVNEKGGTAYGSKIWNKKMSMGGKTGTSQVVSKSVWKNKRFIKSLSEEEKRRLQNHALFVGFGPVENSRYAISVIVEHGGGGSKAAAPIARDILKEAQKLDLEEKV